MNFGVNEIISYKTMKIKNIYIFISIISGYFLKYLPNVIQIL